MNSESCKHPQKTPIWLLPAVLLVITWLAVLLTSFGWKQCILFLIGVGLGGILFITKFGFASAYRNLILFREVQGIYAQLLLLGLTNLLFALSISHASLFGIELRGAIAPLGWQVAIGAFLFGLGMQLGGACGCGTLYTIGGGSLAMFPTLITFGIGSFLASLTRHWWLGLPSMPPFVLSEVVGWLWAVLIQFAVLAVVAIALYFWHKSKPRDLSPVSPQPSNRIFFGAIALAVLGWLTLELSGQPWRITWGFSLGTAQIASILGWNSLSSPFWQSEGAQAVLQRSVLADVSSVMNIGILLGALISAIQAKALSWQWQGGWANGLTHGIGGLIMGYGAFLSFGCNVSAFLGGIASTSLHGWLWIICALLGTWVALVPQQFHSRKAKSRSDGL